MLHTQRLEWHSPILVIHLECITATLQPRELHAPRPSKPCLGSAQTDHSLLYDQSSPQSLPSRLEETSPNATSTSGPCATNKLWCPCCIRLTTTLSTLCVSIFSFLGIMGLLFRFRFALGVKNSARNYCAS